MNNLTARRRLLGADVEKRISVGNPIGVISLARMYPGIKMQGWTAQDSTTGAQLFDRNTVDPGKYVSDTDGTVYESNGTSASDYVLVTGLSYICVTETGLRQWMAFYDAEKTYISGANGYSDPISVPENAVYARFTITNDYVDSFMVNAGQALLPWEPYTGGQPSPSPEYPQEITSAGNWNETDQKWEYEIEISNAEQNPTEIQTVTLQSDRPLTKWDKLEKRNGQWGWVYSSAEIVFDGTEEWAINVNYENVFRHNEQNMQANSEVYSDSYKQILTGLLNESDYGISTGTYVNIKNKNATTIEEFKALLQSNPITVLYQLAEPVFVPLSASEQEQMNALHTFRPTTVLSNDADCEMELTYKTKKSLEVTA